jgi:hypothetical protein
MHVHLNRAAQTAMTFDYTANAPQNVLCNIERVKRGQ